MATPTQTNLDTPDSPTTRATAQTNLTESERFGIRNHIEWFRREWKSADTTSTIFLAIDTEYTSATPTKTTCIGELGLSWAKKDQVSRQVRHFVIKNAQKRRPVPLGPGFSPSIEISNHAELQQKLAEVFEELHDQYQVIVVLGHDVGVDLNNLWRACNWRLPDYAEGHVFDTQCLAQGGLISKTIANLSLEEVVTGLGVETNGVRPHNAANDAWLTLRCAFKQGKLVDGSLTPAAIPIVPVSKQDKPPKKSKTFRKRTRGRSGSESDVDDLGTRPSKRHRPSDTDSISRSPNLADLLTAKSAAREEHTRQNNKQQENLLQVLSSLDAVRSSLDAIHMHERQQQRETNADIGAIIDRISLPPAEVLVRDQLLLEHPGSEANNNLDGTMGARMRGMEGAKGTEERNGGENLSCIGGHDGRSGGAERQVAKDEAGSATRSRGSGDGLGLCTVTSSGQPGASVTAA